MGNRKDKRMDKVEISKKLKEVFEKLIKKYGKNTLINFEDCSKGIYFLFFGSLVDRGQKSEKVWKNLSRLYIENKKIFDPEKVSKMNIEDLAKILKSYGFRFPNQFAKLWIEASKQILEIKIENLLKNPELIYRIKGFGQKTGGLFIKLLIRCGYLKEKEIKVPIDTNDKAFLKYYLGIQNFDKKTIEMIQEIINKIAKELKVSPIILDDIMFLEGRRIKRLKSS